MPYINIGVEAVTAHSPLGGETAAEAYRWLAKVCFFFDDLVYA
jgi:hypothetical protein